MKRIITSLLVFMFCISVVSPVFAEEVSDDADVYAGEPKRKHRTLHSPV